MRIIVLFVSAFALCVGVAAPSSAQESPSPARLPPNPRLAQPVPNSLLWEERGAFWLVEAQCPGVQTTTVEGVPLLTYL